MYMINDIYDQHFHGIHFLYFYFYHICVFIVKRRLSKISEAVALNAKYKGVADLTFIKTNIFM